MRPSDTMDRRFFLRVIMPMIGLIAVLMASAIAGLVVLSSKQNQLSVAMQQRAAVGALRHFRLDVEEAAVDFARRDETARHVLSRFDADWIESHLPESDAVPMAIILAPDDGTMFMRFGGQVTASDAHGALSPGFWQLVRRWRAGGISSSVSGLLTVEGRPMLVAVTGIRTYGERDAPADPAHVLVFGRALSGKTLASLSYSSLLPNLRFVMDDAQPLDGANHLRLADEGGTLSNALVWDPILPGNELLETVGPWLVLAFVGYLAVTVAVLRFARGATRLISLSEEKALHDALTGLPNRMLLLDRLNHMLKPTALADAGAAVLYLDLDGFKAVNDTFGHAAGDAVLVGVAERLNGLCRDDDTVARLGGDEFAMVIATNDRQVVATRAEAILARLGQPFSFANQQMTIGVSIGVALAPEDGHTVSDLLHKADKALYAAKTGGKGDARFFGDLGRADVAVSARAFPSLQLHPA